MAEENGAAQEAGKEKKSPIMLILIIVVLLVVAGGGGAAYFLVLKPKGDAGGQAAPQAAPVQQAAQNAPAGIGGAMGPTVQMEPFIVNLTDAQGTRYLKVSIQMEMTHENLGEEIEQRMPLIRDEIIMILSSKSFEDVSTIAGKRALKRGIINGINKYLRTGQVTRVYFTDFVVQ